ncbi:CapA family protein [Halobacillus sp. A5]|uniref:CapA family protein n=1 Tax=Halobacillus sp. A5 TaxID=2880263 RepID=UPI0020A66BDB|nr:CapA family protein [Halobacillus sp. A5]MCP3027965.1 CapA family protein [Halobacillus sp. A5]
MIYCHGVVHNSLFKQAAFHYDEWEVLAGHPGGGKNVLLFILFAAALILSGCSFVEDSKAADELTSVSHADKAQSEMSWKDATALKGTNEVGHESINIVAAGDVMFEWSLEQTIEKEGPVYPFEKVSDSISEADYALVNLETAVTERGMKDPKQYNFRSPPNYLEGLLYAGFDFVSLANNHTRDYGVEGLTDTLHYLYTYNVDYAGAGYNESDAYKANTVELNGETVSVLAFSQVLPSTDWYATGGQPGIASGYQQQRCLDLIKEAKESSNYTIVYMHWGTESEVTPEKETRDYAEAMVKAGADAVIGSHPHVLQGFELIDGSPVAYSLGNFLFPDYVEGVQAQTGLLQLELHNGSVDIGFVPWKIEDDQLVNPGTAYQEEQWAYLEEISYGVTLDQGAIRSTE